jgi:hypothetical protein
MQSDTGPFAKNSGTLSDVGKQSKMQGIGNGGHSSGGKKNRRAVHRKDVGLNGSKCGKRIRMEGMESPEWRQIRKRRWMKGKWRHGQDVFVGRFCSESGGHGET